MNRFLAIAFVLNATGSLLVAQRPSPSNEQNPVVMHQLTPTIYWAEGGVSNSGIIIGESGVIVVDAKMTAASAKEMLDDIAKITSKPVVALILTHSDGDHIGGMSAFPAGIQIIAHQNCATEMQQPQNRPGGGQGGPQGGQGTPQGPSQAGSQSGQGMPSGGPGGAQGPPAGGEMAQTAKRMPNKIIAGNREEMTVAGVHLVLLHWVPAHTTGDLVIDLPDQKIVFAGDLLTENPTPLIHLEKHGSSEGWITSATGLAALNADRYVPGHGDVTDAASIRALVAKFAAIREKMKGLVAQGKTLDEVKAAVGDPTPAGARFPSFIDVVYQELAQKAN